MRCPKTLGELRRPGGFTMIELLVVIVVLALLISLVTVIASKAIRQQKGRNTQQIMQNVTLALDQFATENPLRAIYDKKGRKTFGKYPAYQLAGDATDQDTVRHAVEPDPLPGSTPPTPPPDSLSNRLLRDLSNGRPGNWVDLAGQEADGLDDNRALYAYLVVFSPGSLNLIPEAQLKPLNANARAFVNPTGAGTQPGDEGVVDVLGIHDAWGVPLDYMLYVKCEWRLAPGATAATWAVTERKPVLRSRGIKREVYDAWAQLAQDDLARRRLSPPDKWLFTEGLPRPWARLSNAQTGVLDNSQGSAANGWVRVVGLNEDYAYRPDGDAETP
ncbi:MAG: prepilin-type N-terminal cleavage/methylation domain-containing protein [Phycisphaerae bacterium]